MEWRISLARNVVATEIQAPDRMSSRNDAASEMAADVAPKNDAGRVVGILQIREIGTDGPAV